MRTAALPLRSILMPILLWAAMLAAAGWQTAPAETIRFEAENVFDCDDQDYPLFQYPYPDGNASGGYAVEGFDRVDMWIELEMTNDEEFCFVHAIHSAGEEGLVRTYEVKYLNYFTYEVVAVDTLVTPPGLGHG
ncbi:MAG: hypothetical protein GF355_04505 [Candidatus Eisenbacteria bacterium]|nr:hypothetical protein [Candidatus Eisenbacteria bacterium]